VGSSESLVDRVNQEIEHSYRDPIGLLEIIYVLKLLKQEHNPKVVDLLIDTVKSHMDFWAEDAGLIIIVDILDIIIPFKRFQDIDFISSMISWDLYQVPSQILLLVRQHGWMELWGKILTMGDISDEYDQYIRKQYFETQSAISDTSGPLMKLDQFLDQRCEEEAQYQEFFETYPWVLGAQYKRMESHSNLDDKNIPDITGVRVHDDHSDIIEIKQPFLKLFRKDGKFSP